MLVSVRKVGLSYAVYLVLSAGHEAEMNLWTYYQGGFVNTGDVIILRNVKCRDFRAFINYKTNSFGS